MLLCFRDSASFLLWSLKNRQCTILKLIFCTGWSVGENSSAEFVFLSALFSLQKIQTPTPSKLPMTSQWSFGSGRVHAGTKLTLWTPGVKRGEINKTCTRRFRLLAVVLLWCLDLIICHNKGQKSNFQNRICWIFAKSYCAQGLG